MKTVTCAICKKEVSKRQTLMIGDGKRACREHTEAQQSSAILLQKEKLEKEKKAEEEQRKKEAHHIPTEPACGVCGNVGMRAQEFYFRLFVEMEKYELATGKAPNMFNPDSKELNKIKGSLAGVRCLFPVTIEVIKKKKVRLTRDAWRVAEIIGLTLMCADCMCKHGVEQPVPNITLDQMALLGTAVEVFVRPEMKKKALDELSKDQ